MKTILRILYGASFFYSIYFFSKLISYYRKNRSFVGILNSGITNKYTAVILLICLVAPPLNLYYSIKSEIPETTYVINGILKIDGDNNNYSVPIKIDYFEDIYYIEDEGHDYLFDGGISTKREVSKVFSLLDITPPSYINIQDFIFEDFEALPETIVSNETYDIDVYGQWVEGYDRFGKPETYEGYTCGQLSIPPITKESLGITIEDQLRSISVWTYAEHAIIFVLAIFNAASLKKDKCEEEKPSEDM